ncbi:amidohydrolase family protein [Kribbella sp. NPDC026596]|uniref:amidohydrolase family protein n=1 Tax=Kribbella sp. NPDC026596 TaxID=3155122 RepID=UPI0033E4E551
MYAVRAAACFDGERFVAGGATVLVDGRRILGVEAAAYDLPADCPLHDLGDATVLPGLIDTHVHLVADSGSMALDRVAGYSDEEIEAVVTEALRRHLAAGVTMVRDLGDRNFNVVNRRDAQRARDDGLPWIVASGPPITTPHGHCWYLGGEAAGADALQAAVRQRVERRVNVVKVMASGGINTPDSDIYAPQFALDDLRRLVDAAHAAGLAVTAHAHAALAIDQAVTVGTDGLEHAGFLTRSEDAAAPGLAALRDISASDAQLQALAASGMAVCPTVGGFTVEALRRAPEALQQRMREAGVTPEELIEKRQGLVRRMHGAGVRLVGGADAGIAPNKAHGLYVESIVELAAVAGVVDSLAASTSIAAQVCGLGERKGKLAPGYDADLIVVAGDLARDLTGLREVRKVVVRGQPVG